MTNRCCFELHKVKRRPNQRLWPRSSLSEEGQLLFRTSEGKFSSIWLWYCWHSDCGVLFAAHCDNSLGFKYMTTILDLKLTASKHTFSCQWCDGESSKTTVVQWANCPIVDWANHPMVHWSGCGLKLASTKMRGFCGLPSHTIYCVPVLSCGMAMVCGWNLIEPKAGGLLLRSSIKILQNWDVRKKSYKWDIAGICWISLCQCNSKLRMCESDGNLQWRQVASMHNATWCDFSWMRNLLGGTGSPTHHIGNLHRLGWRCRIKKWSLITLLVMTWFKKKLVLAQSKKWRLK